LKSSFTAQKTGQVQLRHRVQGKEGGETGQNHPISPGRKGQGDFALIRKEGGEVHRLSLWAFTPKKKRGRMVPCLESAAPYSVRAKEEKKKRPGSLPRKGNSSLSCGRREEHIYRSIWIKFLLCSQERRPRLPDVRGGPAPNVSTYGKGSALRHVPGKKKAPL